MLLTCLESSTTEISLLRCALKQIARFLSYIGIPSALKMSLLDMEIPSEVEGLQEGHWQIVTRSKMKSGANSGEKRLYSTYCLSKS